jgi:hypothetical protein
MKGKHKAYKLVSRHLSSAITSIQSRTCTTNLTQTEADSPFFHYTSGRWLYNEQLQLERRYVKFNVPALQQAAGQVLGTRCIQMTKLPEGMYNKVFSLRMENGEEVLARIPNPNAGHSRYCVGSEVATLDFVCRSVFASSMRLANDMVASQCSRYPRS